MSTTTATPESRTTLDLSQTKPISFLTQLRVELRKSYDTRAGLWLLIVIAAFAALAMGIVVAVGLTQADFEPEFGTFFSTTNYTTAVLLPVLGIMLVTSEWNQRTAMVTFTLEPRRTRVVLAKLVAGLLLALVVAVVATAIAAICNLLYGLLSGDGASWSLGEVSVPGFLLLQTIGMLSGFALAALFLNTAAAIVVFFLYSFVLPPVFLLAAALLDWVRDIQPWIDFSAAQGPLFDWSMEGEDWAHLAVSGTIWLLLPLAIGVWRVLRAEVK